jgi:hypothetical protein
MQGDDFFPDFLARESPATATCPIRRKRQRACYTARSYKCNVKMLCPVRGKILIFIGKSCAWREFGVRFTRLQTRPRASNAHGLLSIAIRGLSRTKWRDTQSTLPDHHRKHAKRKARDVESSRGVLLSRILRSPQSNEHRRHQTSVAWRSTCAERSCASA